MKSLNCVVCAAGILPSSRRSKYCSKVCAALAKKEQKRRPPRDYVCTICAGNFKIHGPGTTPLSCPDCRPLFRKISQPDWSRKSQYGITREVYEQILVNQFNSCAICCETFTAGPYVDHDHLCCSGYKSCGKCLRGLLCQYCNTGLGFFKDDLVRLKSALVYLESGYVSNKDLNNGPTEES